ncbi:putative U-box domain-containing protein 50 [Carya illinoinensis]|uniref:putative U-box domain-containing protein 50 n=1 Tax=Carya illinoinensis TaxID=32201 RepID=UPI001C724796|nr:putative U-box domain-containing protein 50 [Carya illinoinensis]
MDAQAEKIYVAIGNDLQDGFKTLEWTLGKWNSRPISIVILHVAYNISAEFVYTPFGKLPASVVSEEKLEVLRKYEQEKIDKLLSKYITFCGKVKAEILKVEKDDEPVQKLIVDLISRLQINKLVMGFTFMKSSSWKSKGTISGSFYIEQHKPDFCEFYIICGGKQVFLRGQNEERIMEDDHQGVRVARRRDNKASLKKRVGKIFSDQTNTPERSSHHSSSNSSVNSNSPKSKNQWEFHVQEIENYFQQLLSSDLDADDLPQENDSFQIITSHAAESENNDSHMSLAENIESLRSKINEAQQEIELKRKEAKENVERHAKAGWVISLCTQRSQELETSIKEEVKNRSELEKELEAEKEQMNEVIIDIEESKSRLSSLLQLQTELSEKLQISTMEKSQAEVQLEKAVLTRAEMVRDIEELRRQRDVFNRRIEFCREKDAIGMLSKLNEVSCGYREYSAEEIRLATDNFSESKRLKSGGDWTNVYRGRVKHGAVAIKVLSSIGQLSQEAFQAKVDELGQIRHPHLVAMVGLCSELKCIVFEYMHNGSLRDVLSSSNRSSRKRNRALQWLDRVRIAAHVCSGLGFLHMAKPLPMVHGCLALSNILLDRNYVAKIGGYGLSQAHDECGVQLDIRAFGSVMLHLLTGRKWVGLAEEAMTRDRAALIQVLDETAGDWPLYLAEEFACLAIRCLSINSEPNAELSITQVMEELNKMKNKAEDAMKRGGSDPFINGDVDEADSCDVPKVFICPIFQHIMKNPHVAADGFSYELKAIEEWVETGHDTSPITDLRLKHTKVIPNHTLRSLIEDWQSKRSTTVASLTH